MKPEDVEDSTQCLTNLNSVSMKVIQELLKERI